MTDTLDLVENKRRMLAGELYVAFVPDLTKERQAAGVACSVFNRTSNHVGRREQLELIKEMIPTLPPLPPKLDDEAADEQQLKKFPWIEAPFRVDYGSHTYLGEGCFINFGCVILDTCKVSIGARTLFGPDVHLYAAAHPTDPAIRNGLAGPELGKEIRIEEDVWIGGKAVICPGVRVGRGSTVAAGAVVVKDVPPFTVVGGNPARVIKKVESPMADAYFASLQAS